MTMTLGRPIRTADFEENAALWEDAVDSYTEMRENMFNAARIALLKFQTDVNVKQTLKSKLARSRGIFLLDLRCGGTVWENHNSKTNGWNPPRFHVSEVDS